MTAAHHSVLHRFSAAAASYDGHAVAQRTAADLLLGDLPALHSPSRILEVGCGTGHVTSLLRHRFPHSPIDAVDRSETMVDFARRRLSDDTHIRWHAGDLMHFAPPHRYALLVSNAALHWIEPLTDAFRRLHQLAARQAYLACAVMLDGTLGELRASRLRAAPGKPPRGRLPAEGAVVDAVLAGGFTPDAYRVETVETRYPSVGDFLRAIHDMGLTGGPVSRGTAPLNRGDLDRLRADYEHHYTNDDGDIIATYRFLLIHARAT